MKRGLHLFLLCLLFFRGYTQAYFSDFWGLVHIKGGATSSFYNFNSTFSLEEFLELEKKLKGGFEDKGILFVSYISDYQGEETIMELKDSIDSVSITNKNVIFSDGYDNKIEGHSGNILSYSFFRDYYGNKTNGFFINKNFINSNNKILEFIYFPEVITGLDREKIGSYLSIKYGISLYDSYYVSSVGDTLLDLKTNKGFLYSVTGVGRDDGFGLYQRKSANSCSKGLIIGVDSTEIVGNGSFLLWSDNGKSGYLKKDSSKDLGRIDKVWKINLFGDKQNFELVNIEVVSEKLFNNYDNYLEKTDNFLWLVKSSTSDFSSDIVYIRQSKKEGEKIIFEGVDFSDKGYFSFFVGSESAINSEQSSKILDESVAISLSDSVRVYPNSLGLAELFYVDFDLSEPQDVTFFIYDISGREVFKTNFYGLQNYKYSNSLQTTGIYLVTIRIKDKTLVKKMVIK